MAMTARESQEMFLKFENMVKEYRQNANARLSEMDLKGAEILCLQTLMYYPEGLSAASLSNCVDRDKAQISRTLRELHAKGYIECNPEDGARLRKKRWQLTDKGMEVCESILAKSSDIWKDFSVQLTRS